MLGSQLLRCSSLAAVLICMFALPADAQPLPDAGHGQMIAARVCAGCHGMDGIKGGTMIQGIVVPSFRDIAARPDRTQEVMEATVMTPHWPMPAIPLQAREIRDVVGYILSLK